MLIPRIWDCSKRFRGKAREDRAAERTLSVREHARAEAQRSI
jgi:hypothetical protein